MYEFDAYDPKIKKKPWITKLALHFNSPTSIPDQRGVQLKKMKDPQDPHTMLPYY